MFKKFKVHKFNLIILILFFFINFILLNLSKLNYFKNYSQEINLIATQDEIDLFEKFKFTFIDKLTSDLGEEYKIRNFKISGPDYSSIEFYRKSFKNQKKTGLIKSNTSLVFLLKSTNEKKIYYMQELIENNFSQYFNFLRNFKLYNLSSMLISKISFICQQESVILSNKNLICSDLDKKIKVLNYSLESFKINEPNESDKIKINYNLLNKIKIISKDILVIINKDNILENEAPTYYEAIISLLNQIETKNKLNEVTLYNNETYKKKLKFEMRKIKKDSYFNKVVTYSNLVLFLIIFLLLYLKIFFKKN